MLQAAIRSAKCSIFSPPPFTYKTRGYTFLDYINESLSRLVVTARADGRREHRLENWIIERCNFCAVIIPRVASSFDAERVNGSWPEEARDRSKSRIIGTDPILAHWSQSATIREPSGASVKRNRHRKSRTERTFTTINSAVLVICS